MFGRQFSASFTQVTVGGWKCLALQNLIAVCGDGWYFVKYVGDGVGGSRGCELNLLDQCEDGRHFAAVRTKIISISHNFVVEESVRHEGEEGRGDEEVEAVAVDRKTEPGNPILYT